MFELKSEESTPLIPGTTKRKQASRKRDKSKNETRNRNKYSSALATSPPNSLAQDKAALEKALIAANNN